MTRLAVLARNAVVCSVLLAGAVTVGFATGPAAAAAPPDSVTAHGAVPALGAATGLQLREPIVAIAATPDGAGYWLAAADGGVFAFGDAPYLGSAAPLHLRRPIVGITVDQNGWSSASTPKPPHGPAGPGSSPTSTGTSGTGGTTGSGNGSTSTTGSGSAGSTGASGSSGPPTPTGGPGGSWHLTFDSEFNGSALNASKWTNCYPWTCTNTGNSNEVEWYTSANTTVSGGNLNLAAKRQTVSTPYGTRSYTSGLVQTQGKYSFTYGYAEARMYLPSGTGLWPAFWLIPENLTWPPEVDIVESWNTPSRAQMTYIWAPGKQSASSTTGLSAGWHTYAVDWEPGSITWYIDGVARKTITSSQAPIANQAMYLVVNLAVDNGANSSTPLPATMKVDYVRVWQH